MTYDDWKVNPNALEALRTSAKAVLDFCDGKTIQYYDRWAGKWFDTLNPTFELNGGSGFRTKPEPKTKLVPWTPEIAVKYLSRRIVDKDKNVFFIRSIFPFGIEVIGVSLNSLVFFLTYQDLLDLYSLEDGSPCGTVVEVEE